MQRTSNRIAAQRARLFHGPAPGWIRGAIGLTVLTTLIAVAQPPQQSPSPNPDAPYLRPEANRLPDLIGLRQAVYRREDTRNTIDRLLILQDEKVRHRNLIPDDKWRGIEAPVMIVASGKDHGVYQDTARTIADLIPNSEVFEMASVRHWPHFEDPEAFNAAAIEFLTR